MLPVVGLAAAIALASRWSALDQIQASIVQRCTPLAASLGAAVILAAGLRLGAEGVGDPSCFPHSSTSPSLSCSARGELDGRLIAAGASCVSLP